MQDKEVVDGAHCRPETSLCHGSLQAAEANHLSPVQEKISEDDGVEPDVQPVQGLPSGHGPVICRVHGVNLLVNRGHEVRAGQMFRHESCHKFAQVSRRQTNRSRWHLMIHAWVIKDMARG